MEEPKKAFDKAIEFRNSPQGLEVREYMKTLIELGQSSNKQKIKDRLKDLDKQIKEFRRFKLGTTGDPDSFFELIPKYIPFKLGALVKYIVEEFVPREYRESLTSLINDPIKPTGFQILFNNYLKR